MGRRLLVLLVGLVVAVPAAVGTAERAAASPPDVAPNVRGRVLRGPVTPVAREGQRDVEPAAGLGLTVLRGGTVVARVVTGKDGRFLLRLRPGAYVVRATKRVPLQRLSPRAFTVPVGRPVAVQLFLDTGIRAPSPGPAVAS